jgi:hypothetical protein
MLERMSSAVGVGVEGRVDDLFLRAWSRWPLCIATEAGGYLAGVLAVRLGRVMKLL